MVKPCPCKTKEILKSLPAHCPPWKNVNFAAIVPCHSLTQGNIITDFETLSFGEGENLNERPASRCVTRDSVATAATDFQQASLLVLIKAKRISRVTHLRDHRGSYVCTPPFDLSGCPYQSCLEEKR